MIISKKKFKEKIAEALEKEGRERYIHERIERVERECRERSRVSIGACTIWK